MWYLGWTATTVSTRSIEVILPQKERSNYNALIIQLQLIWISSLVSNVDRRIIEFDFCQLKISWTLLRFWRYRRLKIVWCLCNTNEKCWLEFNSKAISFVYASSVTGINSLITSLRMYWDWGKSKNPCCYWARLGLMLKIIRKQLKIHIFT